MPKKLKLFICSILFIFLNLGIAASIESKIIPIKKPILTDQELKNRDLINIIKPIAKPIIIDGI